jgi:hypothetical protein
MQLKKLIDEMPYLMWVAILQLGLFFILTIVFGFVYGLDQLFLPRFWILFLPSMLLVILYAVIRAVLDLQTKSLKYYATVGELDEARTRREVGRPTR